MNFQVKGKNIDWKRIAGIAIVAAGSWLSVQSCHTLSGGLIVIFLR